MTGRRTPIAAKVPWRGMTICAPLVAGALLLIVASAAAPAQMPAALDPGTMAPAFELNSSKGKSFKFDSASTQTTLLVFSYADDRHSSATLELLNDLLDRHAELGEPLRRAWVVTGFGGGRAEIPKFLLASDWPILPDEKGEVTRAFGLIASPTLYVIEPGGRVAASHAGFDPNLAGHLRDALAQAIDPALAKRLSDPPVRANMMLQLGRRMAERGLWERALIYYDRAAEVERLSPEATFELAEIHANLGTYDKAHEILKGVSPPDITQDRIDRLLEEIERKAAGTVWDKNPPVVDR